MMNYFKPEEFKCKCGKCDGGSMDAALVSKLNEARKNVRWLVEAELLQVIN